MGLQTTVYEIQTNDLEFWPSRSSKVKGHITNEFRTHDFLLVCCSNYGSMNHCFLRFRPKTLSFDQTNDLEFWPSRSSKIKGHLIYEFRIHDFLLVCNSKYMSMKHRLRDKDLEFWPSRSSKVKGHLYMNSEYMISYYSAIVTVGHRISIYEMQTNDLEFWPSRSSKVKGYFTNRFTIHDFLLVYNSNYGPKYDRMYAMHAFQVQIYIWKPGKSGFRASSWSIPEDPGMKIFRRD